MPQKRKIPNRSGFWWITLDDGYQYVIAPTLVKVLVHADKYPGELDVDVAWLDDSQHGFYMKTIDQEIVMLEQTIALGIICSARRGEHRITWLVEATAPKNVPVKGEVLPLALQA